MKSDFNRNLQRQRRATKKGRAAHRALQIRIYSGGNGVTLIVEELSA